MTGDSETNNTKGRKLSDGLQERTRDRETKDERGRETVRQRTGKGREPDASSSSQI